MRPLILRRSSSGELLIWEKPIIGQSYIATLDPSFGRETSERSDTSAVGIWKRLGQHQIEQVAEFVTRRPGARVGEILACLGRHWARKMIDGREQGLSVINIERNAHDLPHSWLIDIQRYPPDFCFVPREARAAIIPGAPKKYYTDKQDRNHDYLFNTLIDYFDRGAVHIRSEKTLREIRKLSKNDRGRVELNGRDRATMVILACVTDWELPEPTGVPVAFPQPDPNVVPPGICPQIWRREHGERKPERSLPTRVFVEDEML